LNDEDRGNTPPEEIDFTSNKTQESHDSAKNKPTGRPEEGDVYLAVRIGKERRMVIEMAVYRDERRLRFKAR